ncbi:bacteriohemerythrin [Roseateles albus]|uniref:Bacteriohemerythrin n=1 Tax=Roseateles albus TaxID=2987525 RepID=A0ABT5KHQ1_9BURK|nr:bacteriohemerythrin [Roseateles albus]MDC8773458.1 bacteriohemerythrin [Roseateles albus]
MAYFEWADDMAIDEGPIDDDHMKLVNLVNELHTATSEGRGQEVVEKLMNELITYTKEHLQREEQIMEALRFPNLERHKVGHAKFADQLRVLREKYESGSITVASQLSAVLRDWLSLHIRRSDKEIKVFLQKKTKRSGVMPP